MIALKGKLQAALASAPGEAFTAEALATKVEGDPELAFKILEHLAANGKVHREVVKPWPETTYQV